MVTLLSVGTGGIRNNRRPFHDEEPKDYANRCSVQWHRVSIYPERLGSVVMKNVFPGCVYILTSAGLFVLSYCLPSLQDECL